MLLVLDGVVDMPTIIFMENWGEYTAEYIEAQLIDYFESMGATVAKMDVHR